MSNNRLELDNVFPAPPSRDEELCRIANLPLEPSFDDTGLKLLELNLDPDWAVNRPLPEQATVRDIVLSRCPPIRKP